MSNQRKSGGKPAKLSSTNNNGRRNAEVQPLYVTVGRVDTLSSIQIDSVLQKILSDSDAEIRITISPDSQVSVALMDLESKKRIGGLNDLKRLAGFRQFAATQRKYSEAESVLRPIEEEAFWVFTEERAIHPSVEATRIGPSGITVLKESNLRARILLENEKFIERNATGLPDGYMKDYYSVLLSYVRESLVVERNMVRQVVTGQEHKGFIYDSLFSRYIPKWAYQKLSRTKFAESENFDARRILFPADASKGIHFTIRELNSERFREANSFVLRYSNALVNIFCDATNLKVIFDTKDDVDFENEANVIGQKVRDEKILIVPHYVEDIPFFFEPKARSKFSNFNPRPDFGTPQGTIRTLAQTFVMCHVFEVSLSNQISGLWKKVLSNVGPLESNITARRNFFRAVLDEKTSTVPQIKSFMLLEDEKNRNTFLEWFQVSARLTTQSEILKVVASAISLNPYEKEDFEPEDFPMVFAGTGTLSTPSKAAYASFTNKIEKDSDLKAFEKFKKVIGTGNKSSSKTRGKQNKPTAISALTGESKKILASIRKNDACKFLGPAVEEWLRAFISEKLQDAGARFVAAQLDSLLDDDLADDSSSDVDDDEDDGEDE